MGFLKWFMTWMSSSDVRSEQRGHPDLYPIDVNKLIKELRLVEEAKKYGAAGLPAPDAVDYSSPEKLAIQRVEKARQDYVMWANTRLSVIGEQMATRTITDDINRARQADEEFGRRASQVLSDRATLLRTASASAMGRRGALERFKSQHRLVGDANYPTTAKRCLNLAVVIATVVAEALINANFFAQGLDSGLLGGFWHAAAFAAVNVTFAFVLGWKAVPNVAHRHFLRKMLGWASVMLVIALMLGIGLGISHYRDWLVAGGTGLPVLDKLRSDPLGLNDIFSWLLLAISVICASIAAYEGKKMDDPYPGYGAISRRASEADAEFDDELDNVREQLEELKDEAIAALDDAVQKSKALVANFEGLIEAKRNTATQLNLAMENATNALAFLLQKFQDENEHARGKVARPTYFHTRPELKPLTVLGFEVSPDQSLFIEQKVLVSALLDEVEAIRARIQAGFNQQFDKIKPLENHYLAEGAA